MCDSVVVTRGFTRDGISIFAKNSDRSCNEPQYFVFIPAKDHPRGEKARATFIDIDRSSHTNALILSKPSWIWGGEMGVNEHGVCIGNESVFSRDMDITATALLGMDIVRIALEQASTAREAVDKIGEAMERYGQGGNASFDGVFHYDNAYLVADPNEAWHVETAGKHYWAAKQVQGAYSISNYLSINYPDLMHKDLIAHAKESGYPAEDPFDFAQTYIDWSSPVNHSGMLRRACSFQTVNKPGKNFIMQDMLKVLRSHSVNNPWVDGDTSVCMHAAPNGLDCQTTNAIVAILRPGDIEMWGPGMSIPCSAPFQPFWFDAYSASHVFAYENQEAAMDEWIRRERIVRAIGEGRIPLADYAAEMKALEAKWQASARQVGRADRQPLCDAIALECSQFFAKWQKVADQETIISRGEALDTFWKGKDERLGKDRRIAY